MDRVKRFISVVVSLVLIFSGMILTGCTPPLPPPSPVQESTLKLSSWKSPPGGRGGIRIDSPADKNAFMYLWFYEWNMFEAVKAGQHTAGFAGWDWQVSPDRRRAVMDSAALKLTTEAADEHVDMTLTITNDSDHDWPSEAAIIPCFNPGKEEAVIEENPLFFDLEHTKTYFYGTDGLELLEKREIHFNQALRGAVDSISPEGEFKFSHKWPTSESNATAAVMIRESEDKKWVAGIAWQDFLSAQGHNPWKCMHLAVLVGPLKKGESRTILGRIYLFKGTKEQCLKRFQKDSISKGE